MNCACGHDTDQHSVYLDRPCLICRCPGWHDTPRMVKVAVNGRWPLYMPSHRAYRPEWTDAHGWEPERIESMSRHIRHGDVVYDVGAEQGDMPALWGTWGAEVVLVEPNPLAWPNIRATFEANDLTPAGWFVGFASDSVELHPPGENVRATPRDGWPECAYDPVLGATGFRHLAQETDTTPQVTLDALAMRFPAPTAITIDVEGSEYRVLKGAAMVLANCRPRVWVSVHQDERWMRLLYPDGLSEHVHAFMVEQGYRGELLATDHEAHWYYWPAEVGP